MTTLEQAVIVASGILANPDVAHQLERADPKVLAEKAMNVVVALEAEVQRRMAGG